MYHAATRWTTGAYTGDSYLRFVGLDATTTQASSGSGIIFPLSAGYYGQDHIYLYGNYLHHAGKLNEDEPHGYKVGAMYFSGYGVHNYLYIAWNEIYRNNGTCQFYGHIDSDSIDYLYIHDNYFPVYDGTLCIYISINYFKWSQMRKLFNLDCIFQL